MADGGSLVFEKRLEQIVDKSLINGDCNCLLFLHSWNFQELFVIRLIVVMK